MKNLHAVGSGPGLSLEAGDPGPNQRALLQVTTPTFSAGTPTKMFQRYVSGLGRTYDVSRDGQRFLMIKAPSSPDQTSAAASMVIVLNWHEELKRLVPTK